MHPNQSPSHATSIVPSEAINVRIPSPNTLDPASPCIPIQTLLNSVFEFAGLTQEERLHLDGGCRSCNQILCEMRIHEELYMDPAWDNVDHFSRRQEILRRIESS